MVDALTGLVARLLMAAALFCAILLVAFCAYTPQIAEERRAAECPVMIEQATVKIANQRFSIPAGPNTHIIFDASDKSRTHVAWTRQSSENVFVFCENDIAERPDATEIRIGKEVLRQHLGASTLSAFKGLHSIYFGTAGYLPMGDIPPVALPTRAQGSDIPTAVEGLPLRTAEKMHITAGWLDSDIRIWTACNPSLLNNHPTCRVGIIQRSDGMIFYLGNILPREYPQLNKMPSDEIGAAAVFLTTIIDHFRLPDSE